MLAPPPGELAPPPRGNPGSATADPGFPAGGECSESSVLGQIKINIFSARAGSQFVGFFRARDLCSKLFHDFQFWYKMIELIKTNMFVNF